MVCDGALLLSSHEVLVESDCSCSSVHASVTVPCVFVCVCACLQVWIHHVGSGKVVAKLHNHQVNVRDLDYDTDRNILATCSFDKTVSIFTYNDSLKGPLE